MHFNITLITFYIYLLTIGGLFAGNLEVRKQFAEQFAAEFARKAQAELDWIDNPDETLRFDATTYMWTEKRKGCNSCVDILDLA